MKILDTANVIGDRVNIKTTGPKHINGKYPRELSDNVAEPFAKMMISAVNKVNNLEFEANEMEQKLAISPDEVNIHEVMIASEKARLSVSFFKTIVDKAIKAYQDIMMKR